MAAKDLWNSQEPAENDSQFAQYVLQPELANLIANVLYPAAFPNLAAYVKANKPRNDLAAILLTGIPTGVVPASRTTPARCRPTCCGSTSRCRRPRRGEPDRARRR